MLETAARFTRILHSLRNAVATFVARQARGPLVVVLGTRTYVEKPTPSPHRPIPTEIWILLIHRVERLSRRFRRLVECWRTGTLPVPRPARAPRATPRARTAPPALRLPRERGWINRRIAESGPCAGDLLMLLQQSDLPRLVAEVPRAGRLLRPLCHALALDLPAWLALPPRPRPAKVRPPRAVPPTPGAGLPDRKPPRYVLAAARAWKKRAS